MIEGGDEDSVSKLAGKEPLASERRQEDTAEVRRERDGAETDDACLDENSVYVKVFRGTRAKKTVTGLEEPLRASDDDEWVERRVGAMQIRI